MSSLFKPASTASTPFDPGTYVATIHDLVATDHKEYGVGIRWVLYMAPDLAEPEDYVVNEDDSPSTLFAPTSQNMGPKSNARKYAEAFLNRPLEPEEQLEKDDLVGKKALVQVVDNKGTDGNIYSKVVGISPYKGAPSKVRTRSRPKEDNLDSEESDGLPF